MSVPPPPTTSQSGIPTALPTRPAPGRTPGWSLGQHPVRNGASLVFVAIALIGRFVGSTGGQGTGINEVGHHITAFGAGALLVLWLGVLAFNYSRFLNMSARAGIRAIHPIPLPVEIHRQLHAQYGRPPTPQEVAATQQMLATARNQDLVTASIGLASVVAVREALKHR